MACLEGQVGAYDINPSPDVIYSERGFGSQRIISPSGENIVAGGSSLTALDLISAAILYKTPIQNPEDYTSFLSYSFDGNFIASCYSNRGRLFNAHNGTQYGYFYTSETLKVATFIPNTELIAFMTNRGRIFVFNYINGQMHNTFFAIDQPANEARNCERLLLNADGTKFIVTWRSYYPDKWGFNVVSVTGGPSDEHLFPFGTPNSVDFFNDGSRILVTKDGTIRIYDLNTWQILQTIVDDSKAFPHLYAALSPTGNYVAWSDDLEDGGVKVWIQRVSDGKIVRLCTDPALSAFYSSGILWTSDEKYIYSAGRLWRTSNTPFRSQPWPADGLHIFHDFRKDDHSIIFEWTPRHVDATVRCQVYRNVFLYRDLGTMNVDDGYLIVNTDNMAPGTYELRLTKTDNPSQKSFIKFGISEYELARRVQSNLRKNEFLLDETINFPWDTYHVDDKTLNIDLYRGETLVKRLAGGLPMEQGNMTWKIDVGPGKYFVILTCDEDDSIKDFSEEFEVVAVRNDAVNWAMYE